MFSQSIKLGKVFGIPIGANYSWLIIFLLITMSLSAYFGQLHPEWGASTTILLGIITSILFFGSVLVHEVGHALVGRSYGIPAKAITLFVFGGVSQITKEPKEPFQEFAVGVIGPVVSFALGGIFYLLSRATLAWSDELTLLFTWLGRINITLAAFNLIPGFPLDGGRVLRSIVWHYTKNFERATRIAAGAGQFFAYAFILYGIWIALTGNFAGGLWIGFIGWFLLNAAQSTVHQAEFRRSLDGLTANDVMATDCVKVHPETSVAEFVEHSILRSWPRCSVVTDNGNIKGIITLHEIRKVPRTEWNTTSVGQIMIPEEKLVEVAPETPVSDVLQRMSEDDISQVPVVDRDGHLAGMIGRDRLLSLVRTHMELKS